jgi:flagellar motor switch protein FliN/FliY
MSGDECVNNMLQSTSHWVESVEKEFLSWGICILGNLMGATWAWISKDRLHIWGRLMSEERNEDPAVYDIEVEVTAVLGVATLLVNQLLKLGRGAVVELGQNVGDPIDLRINNQLIGRGEVVVVEDRLAISITEMVQANK